MDGLQRAKTMFLLCVFWLLIISPSRIRDPDQSTVWENAGVQDTRTAFWSGVRDLVFEILMVFCRSGGEYHFAS